VRGPRDDAQYGRELLSDLSVMSPVEGESGFDQVVDARGAAAELAQQPPRLQGCDDLLAEGADLGTGDDTARWL